MSYIILYIEYIIENAKLFVCQICKYKLSNKVLLDLYVLTSFTIIGKIYKKLQLTVQKIFSMSTQQSLFL